MAGNKLSCRKLVSECHAELHVTLSKHHNETHAMKMTNHNSNFNYKTASPNVEIGEYKSAMAKWQSIIAEHQGTVTNRYQHIAKAK